MFIADCSGLENLSASVKQLKHQEVAQKEKQPFLCAERISISSLVMFFFVSYSESGPFGSASAMRHLPHSRPCNVRSHGIKKKDRTLAINACTNHKPSLSNVERTVLCLRTCVRSRRNWCNSLTCLCIRTDLSSSFVRCQRLFGFDVLRPGLPQPRTTPVPGRLFVSTSQKLLAIDDPKRRRSAWPWTRTVKMQPITSTSCPCLTRTNNTTDNSHTVSVQRRQVNQLHYQKCTLTITAKAHVDKVAHLHAERFQTQPNHDINFDGWFICAKAHADIVAHPHSER